jgi:hypothetical protein
MQTIENDYAMALPATAADGTMQNNYGTSTGWSQWKLTERIAVEEQIKANREIDLDEVKV